MVVLVARWLQHLGQHCQLPPWKVAHVGVCEPRCVRLYSVHGSVEPWRLLEDLLQPEVDCVLAALQLYSQLECHLAPGKKGVDDNVVPSIDIDLFSPQPIASFSALLRLQNLQFCQESCKAIHHNDVNNLDKVGHGCVEEIIENQRQLQDKFKAFQINVEAASVK